VYTHLGVQNNRYPTTAQPRNPASAILLPQCHIDWEEWKSFSGAPSFVIDNQTGKSVAGATWK